MQTHQPDDRRWLHADDLEAERITPGEGGEPDTPRDVNDRADDDDDEDDEDEEEDEHDPGELIVNPEPS